MRDIAERRRTGKKKSENVMQHRIQQERIENGEDRESRKNITVTNSLKERLSYKILTQKIAHITK